MTKREPRSPSALTPKLPATYEEAMIRRATHLIEAIEGKLTESAGEHIAALLRERLRRGLTDRQRVIDARKRRFPQPSGLDGRIP